MKKFLFSFLIFGLLPFGAHAATQACTREYNPVCATPPMPECSLGLACMAMAPAPQTYDNYCLAKAAGATYLEMGTCGSTTTSTTTTSTTTKVCTMEYAPVCGLVQVQCVKAPCAAVKTDYSNRCMAEAAGAWSITSGTCTSSNSTSVIVGNDRDSHGCIPSAGYTWDSSLSACVRPWEYQGVVDWAYNNKITQYNTLSEFRYGSRLSRQEAASFISRFLIDGLGREEVLCKVMYKDSASIDRSLSKDISRACGFGVMRGSNGYFHPTKNLSRAEALAIAIRAIDGQKQDESYTPWYQNYINRAKVLGLTVMNQSTRQMNEAITRGEFISWLKALSTPTTTSTTTSSTTNTATTNSASDTNLIADWKLDSYQIGSLLYVGSGQLLTFDKNQFSVRFCNILSGKYTASNGVISAGSVMSTMMACSDNALTIMESGWNLDGATYSIKTYQNDLRTWLIIKLKSGGIFSYIKK